MKRKALFFMMAGSIALLLSSCVHVNLSGMSVGMVGNGIAKDDNRGAMEFTAVETSGAIDVIIVKESDAPVIVSGDENLVDEVETTVNGGKLRIKFKKNTGYNSKIGLRVKIPNSGRISRITSSGAANVIVEDVLVADELSVSCSGSADFKGDIKANKCELLFSGSADFKGNVETVSCRALFSGASDCHIKGSADICKASMSGSSDFKGYDFIVKKLEATASGASDIQVTCLEEMSATASGSSDISYRGTARMIDRHRSGASDIKHVE